MLFRKSNLWNNATLWNQTWMLPHCLSLNRCQPCHCQPVPGELMIDHLSSHGQISPHHCCHLIVLIKTKWWHKKNGEKTMHVWNVSVLLLSFSINVCFPSKPEINHLLPQAKFSPVTAASCLCLLKKSGDTKRMVRNHCIFVTLQLFHLPFIQLDSCFWGERVSSVLRLFYLVHLN